MEPLGASTKVYEHDNTVRFAERGTNVKLYPYLVFINPEKIHFANEVIVSEFCSINGGAGTFIGNFIHISSFCTIIGGGLSILEDFVGICAGARIITGTDLINGEGLPGPTIPLHFRAAVRSYVHLEKHVFLGTNAIVHPGITIGEGAVIGSGSVVTKDVEPWTINVGAPLRVVSKRPSEKIKEMERRIYDETTVLPFDVSPLLSRKVPEMLNGSQS